MLDDIVTRFYGASHSRIVESVLEANPGLASYGPKLPAGLIVRLPAKTSSSSEKMTFLWSQ